MYNCKRMKILRFLLGLFRPEPKFVPDPRMEEQVTRINQLVTDWWIIAQGEWGYKYTEDTKQNLRIIAEEIKQAVSEGGEDLENYVRPWKEVKKYDYKDLPKVRVADVIWPKAKA